MTPSSETVADFKTQNKTELEIREFLLANNSMNRQTDNEVKRCLDAYKKLSSECQ